MKTLVQKNSNIYIKFFFDKYYSILNGIRQKMEQYPKFPTEVRSQETRSTLESKTTDNAEIFQQSPPKCLIRAKNQHVSFGD